MANVPTKDIPIQLHGASQLCSSTVRYRVGDLTRLPQTFCGLYTYAHRDSYSFEWNAEANGPISRPILLHPGQKLRVAIDSGKDTGWKTKAVKAFWKITQKLEWIAISKDYGNFTTEPSFDYWTCPLNEIDGGIIEVPSLHTNSELRYTHDFGGDIQVVHEMIVYANDETSRVLATSPITKVILTPGFVNADAH